MIGGIVGDVIGSVYEHNPVKNADFPLFGDGATFTDDTVLTLAVAEAILHKKDYGDTLRNFFLRHPNRRYGSRFTKWAKSWDNQPSDSFGNGAAMRASPVGWAFNTLGKVLAEAEKCAIPTHNSPEGIKGAQAVAAAILLARTGKDKAAIKDYVGQSLGYDLSLSFSDLKELGDAYGFESACQKTVPPALAAFLDSSDWEDAVRKAVSLGWDSDTMACITGAIAEAYYGGVPVAIEERVLSMLPPDLKRVAKEFDKQYLGAVRNWEGACHLCGKVVTITCMAVGYMTYAPGACVCTTCSRSLGGGDFNKGWRIAKEKLKEQPHRICSVCMRTFDKPLGGRSESTCSLCSVSIPETLSAVEYLQKLYKLRHRQHFQESLRKLK